VRLDFSFGSQYRIAGEYYHPFTRLSRWFISPQAFAQKVPLNLYSSDSLLAEYRLSSVGGGADVGYEFDRFSELRFGYQAGFLKASRYVGSPQLPTGSGRTGVTRLRYDLDRLDQPIIPHSGVALQGAGEWVDANLAAPKPFPLAEASVTGFYPLNVRASIFGNASGGTTFGHEQTGLPPFTLGGPFRLAAYGINEFLVNQYFYFRLGYLRRIATLPPFLGTGIYALAAYEVAKPYAVPGLPTPPSLPNDGEAGVVIQTALGPILLGGSVGQGGNGKWFFQLGKLF